MKRFNPTAPPRAAIGNGLICQSADRSIYKRLAAGADLTPGSQQLLVGGIGSGKTTELLMAESELKTYTHTLPLYIDVSAETDLSAVNAGALLACLGMRLWEVIQSGLDPPKELGQSYQTITKAAYGYERSIWIDESDYPPDPDFSDEPDDQPGHFLNLKVAGKLRPPFPAFDRDVAELAESVSKLTGFLEEQGLELVVIFDGLDRLISVDKFWSVAEQDLRAMRPLEISVLAAGPLSIMNGTGRQVKDYFEEVHYMPPAIADPKVSPFLLEVLRVRGAGDLMSRENMQRICLASGGVLRDLISLARNAGENAYLDDADAIDSRHIDRSIEQLGSSYLLGLGTRQKEILRKLLDGGGFTPSDAEGMELLISRRILEQSGSRYEVHPALTTLMQQSTAEET